VTADLGAWLAGTRAWCDAALDRLVPAEDVHPARLHAALRYALFGGGKRLRPALLRLVSESCGGDEASAERPAAALELIHTYSLVHDDLPCMDDDALRRGRPTVHVAYDEATAVLVGDALQTLAFEVLAGAEHGRELAGVLARGAGSTGMVGGQVLDLSLELTRSGVGLEDVLDMHARKTAALFAAAGEMGAVVAGAEPERRERARAFGAALGMAFQAVDDVLDVTGDASTLGKTPGKDAALERATLVAAVGLEEGRSRAETLARAARDAAAGLGFRPGDFGLGLVDLVLERKA